VDLSPAQRQHLEQWMHSKGIGFDDAAYVRALLEEGEPDLVESGRVVKIPCDNCRYVSLFDIGTLSIRGS
jgi:hypothetical protein